MKRGRVLFNGAPMDVFFDGELRGPSGERLDGKKASFLPPSRPSKIVCVGRNYAAHAKELGNEMPGEPLLFLKAPSSLLAHGGIIVLPAQSERVEYEGEIALIVKDRCSRIPGGDDPLRHILGVMPLNDVTARDLQKKDVQFTRAKSFDTFCPCGPFYEDEFDAASLEVKTILNGKLVQKGAAREMAFPIPLLVRYISEMMTLEPGDIIATGTPHGVGMLADGDEVSVEVAGIKLDNKAGTGRS